MHNSDLGYRFCINFGIFFYFFHSLTFIMFCTFQNFDRLHHCRYIMEIVVQLQKNVYLVCLSTSKNISVSQKSIFGYRQENLNIVFLLNFAILDFDIVQYNKRIMLMIYGVFFLYLWSILPVLAL